MLALDSWTSSAIERLPYSKALRSMLVKGLPISTVAAVVWVKQQDLGMSWQSLVQRVYDFEASLSLGERQERKRNRERSKKALLHERQQKRWEKWQTRVLEQEANLVALRDSLQDLENAELLLGDRAWCHMVRLFTRKIMRIDRLRWRRDVVLDGSVKFEEKFSELSSFESSRIQTDTIRIELKARCQVSESGCWVWARGFTNRGLPRFHVGGRKKVLAHRIAYEAFCGGQVAPGDEIERSCGSRACIRPEHLRLIPHNQVSQRRAEAARRNFKLPGMRNCGIK